MRFSEGTATNSALLRSVRKTDNQPAWTSFVRFYSPLLRQCCRDLHLDHDSADEVAQRVWVELLRLMPEFSYQPGFGFRRWLHSLCRHRAIDLIRHRDGERARLERLGLAVGNGFQPEPDLEDSTNRDRARIALEICQTVRRRTKPKIWQAFEHITVDGWTVRETADALNMTYTAAFMARKRVEAKLREEASRRFSNS